MYKDRKRMTKKELALEYHKKGYNCTQAVACAFCGEFGVSEEEMYKIAEGFGLGMGMMDTCGALTGLFMLIGMKNSGGVEQAGKTKADTYKKTREYAAKFKEINGSVYCKELKGVETGKILAPCDKCILDAVELAEQFLKEN